MAHSYNLSIQEPEEDALAEVKANLVYTRSSSHPGLQSVTLSQNYKQRRQQTNKTKQINMTSTITALI